jgi:hypothetical protein
LVVYLLNQGNPCSAQEKNQLEAFLFMAAALHATRNMERTIYQDVLWVGHEAQETVGRIATAILNGLNTLWNGSADLIQTEIPKMAAPVVHFGRKHGLMIGKITLLAAAVGVGLRAYQRADRPSHGNLHGMRDLRDRTASESSDDL